MALQEGGPPASPPPAEPPEPPDAPAASLFAAIRAEVRECRGIQQVECALSEGASVDSTAALEAEEEEDGFLTGNATALMLAIALGRKRIAKLLLERGADVHVRASSGVTALHVAVLCRDVKMSLALATAGGGVNEAAAAGIYCLTPMLIGETEGCARTPTPRGAHLLS